MASRLASVRVRVNIRILHVRTSSLYPINPWQQFTPSHFRAYLGSTAGK